MSLITLLLIAFPALYVIHSTTELLLLRPWLRWNAHIYFHKSKSNSFALETFRLVKSISRSKLFILACGEFGLIAFATLIAINTGDYSPWLALLFGFMLHLYIHVAHWLLFKRYVPAIISTFIAIPYCVYSIDYMVHVSRIPITNIIYCAIFGIIICFINLFLILRFVSSRRVKRFGVLN